MNPRGFDRRAASFTFPCSFRLVLPALALAGVSLMSIWGCAQAGGLEGGGSTLGVTTGGQQDIASARKTIEEGGIPEPASITVEGFLSEHSIPIDAPADAGLLYATAAVAWNRDFDAFTPLVTVQVGFGTTVDSDTFERSSLNLALVIDRSGSMADPVDVRSGATRLDAVKIAVDRLLSQLTGLDRVSVVTFNTRARTRLEYAAGNDIAAIKTALEEVEAMGGTDLAAGIRRGYDIVAEHSDTIRSDRVIIFTDALLTASNQQQVDEFLGVIEQRAGDGIGATVFGVGVDFGHDVAFAISQVRGGNYFFLSDFDRIVSVFDEDFEFLVTPVAFDVALAISVPFEFDVDNVYGIPVTEPLTHALELSIPTLFLSSREGGGALLIRVRAGGLVDFGEPTEVARMALSYTTPDGQTVVHPTVTATLPAGLDETAGERYFQTPGTQRAVLLLNTALVLKNALEDLHSDGGFAIVGGPNGQRAQERLSEFLPYFDDLAEGLNDQSSPTSRRLSDERALVEQLLANIR